MKRTKLAIPELHSFNHTELNPITCKDTTYRDNTNWQRITPFHSIFRDVALPFKLLIYTPSCLPFHGAANEERTVIGINSLAALERYSNLFR